MARACIQADVRCVPLVAHRCGEHAREAIVNANLFQRVRLDERRAKPVVIDGKRRITVRGLCYAERAVSSTVGYALHARAPRMRPPAFGVRPPTCLKKNGTPRRRQASRSFLTHSKLRGR